MAEDYSQNHFITRALAQAGDDCLALKALLKQARHQLEQDYTAVDRRPRLRSTQLLARHSRLIDRFLQHIWRQLAMPADCALVAVGGYGRQELFPRSDIDLLIILSAQPDSAQTLKLEKLVGLLWDIGLEVGHSIRTIEQCVEESRDVSVQTNLLEARLLSGHAQLFSWMQQAMQQHMDPRQFYLDKTDEQLKRHQRFLDTDFNLEPNLKESPGGLRDLQNIIWISKAAGLGTSWKQLAQAGLITENDARQISRHEHLLQALRIRLHYLAKRGEDRLLFDFQPAIAEQMGMTSSSKRHASERLMQRYYRSKIAIRLFNRILIKNLRDHIFGKSEKQLIINQHFKACGNALEIRDPEIFQKRPRTIFEFFLRLSEHPELTEIGTTTLRALWQARQYINADFRKDPVNRQHFIELFRKPHGILHNLRNMNLLGILGRYIPEFGRIVGQMQYDLFHVFTVDEHTMMVIRNLRRFALEEHQPEHPLCSQLLKSFARPEVLYIAGLFHDIAKGRGGDHSQLGKVDALRFCQRHQLRPDDCQLVEWLVANHLTLSSTAQKKDLTDPDVIADFASGIKNQRYLTALYLLTVADVRGTSPKVWNAWKDKLLETLYRATQRYLREGYHHNQLEEIRQEATYKLNLYTISPESYELLWAQLDDNYFLDHDAATIAWHTRLLAWQVNTNKPLVRTRLSRVGEGIEVMVYCHNRSSLFACICDFFAGMNYTIVEAKLHATHHGYVLNSFQVMEANRNYANYRDFMGYVEFELAEKIKNHKTIRPRSSGRITRQLKHFPVNTRLELQPANRGLMVLSLSAGDRPGLLANLAIILDKMKIDVHYAKINTLGGRVEDFFWISGAPLENQQHDALLDQLRRKLT